MNQQLKTHTLFFEKTASIDFYNAPVGIMVSGGADSALLLYYILKNTTNHIDVFTLYNDYKLGYNTQAAIKVVGFLTQYTGNRNLTHHIKYVEKQDRVNLWELPKEFINQGNIQILYSGITCNPPDNVIKGFRDQTPNDGNNRDPNVTRDIYYNNYFHTPLTNLDKKQLAKLYKDEGLMDNLFPLTRSCEWSESLSEHAPNPEMGHCGICWWCEERKWGFNKL